MKTKEKSQKICDQCGKLYSEVGRKGRGGRFCSVECYRVFFNDPVNFEDFHAGTFMKICEECGMVEFRTSRKNPQRYCSKKCFHFHHKNDIEMHQRIRQTLLGPRKTLREADATRAMGIRMRALLRRIVKLKRPNLIVEFGYTPQELRAHLEALWTEGMSWENYGRTEGCWHIDHIRPVNTFMPNAQSDVVNTLKNLRPLWESENRHRPQDGSDIPGLLEIIKKEREEFLLSQAKELPESDSDKAAMVGAAK
jgi:hypothetical protein